MDKFNAIDQLLSLGSPLIVISNRLPFKIQESKTEKPKVVASNGGLVTSLLPIVEMTKGTWIGSSGGLLVQEINNDYQSATQQDYRVRCVNIPGPINEVFYNEVCNGCLWPLFHSMPERALFLEKHSKAYEMANNMFTSEAFLEIAKCFGTSENLSAPVVWIHDFHLMLIPQALRENLRRHGYSCKLMYFFHIPFPPKHILQMLPWYQSILKSVLACDFVAFQTVEDEKNFLDACHTVLGCSIEKDLGFVTFKGRACKTGAYPIAIPYEEISHLAEKGTINRFCRFKIILGVDRMDYTKGLLEKLKGFEHLLETYPSYRENVVLVQLAVPSRENVPQYNRLKHLFEQEVGRINGKYSTLAWSPIKYLYRELPRKDIFTLYRQADVVAVTPIKDGMNLVAKEFVACQGKNPGVLVLSTKAGSAETMTEAILVDPSIKEKLAEAFRVGLEMSKKERQLRMDALKAREKAHDVYFWFDSLLQVVLSPKAGLAISISKTRFGEVLGDKLFAKNHLTVFLDYDGTLAPISSTPSEALLPRQCREIILRMREIPRLKLVILSGRSLSDVRHMVNIEGITYAGNHGLHIMKPCGEKFTHPQAQKFKELVRWTCTELERKLSSTEGWVENKGLSLAFHYRKVVGKEERVAIVDKVIYIVERCGLVVKHGKCVIEGCPPCTWSKGDAALQILGDFFGDNWSEQSIAVAIGDDVTDEDCFRALKRKGYSFKVTHGNQSSTAADYALEQPSNVCELLAWILSKYEV